MSTSTTPFVLPPAWSFQGKDSAKDSRYLLGTLFAQKGANPNSTWRSGVLSTTSVVGVLYPVDLWVQQNATPNLGVSIVAGNYIIDHPSQGPYIGDVQANITSASTGGGVTFDTAPGTGQSRIDSVYIQVLDTGVGDSTLNAQIVVQKGTAAATGSQVAPAAPSTGVSIKLADVTVGPNVSTIVAANIADKRMSASVGGLGPRFLLPGDALTDPGNVWGETRKRVLTTYGNLVVEDEWNYAASGSGSWRGCQSLQLAAGNITINTNVWTTGEAVTCTLTIPDPGFPYYVDVDAVAFVPFISGGAYGELHIRDTNLSGVEVHPPEVSETNVAGCSVAIRGLCYAGGTVGSAFTGAKTLVVTAQSSSNANGQSMLPHAFTAMIVPA